MVLSGRYPNLLKASAWERAFTVPQAVYEYEYETVEKVMRRNEQWLVVAGWECQDLSAAGSGKGLGGVKSRSYYKLVELVKWWQCAAKEYGNPAVGYLIENTAFQYNWKSVKVSTQDFAEVNLTLGQPVVIEAAQCGSRAHRLRNYWTNLVEHTKLAKTVELLERPGERLVQDIGKEGRVPAAVTRSD